MLTRSQLLRMPARDYMNAEQLAFFRNRLLKMRAEALEDIQATRDHLRETERATDELDRAVLEGEYALEIRLQEREATLVRKIDEALRRIKDGSYGYCKATGEPIGLKRLLARPTATLSIEAKERAEARERVLRDE
ncbi:RNA polymerase-binding protein DksA [Thioalkalivibrio sulfidiphilus]|uniref:RNA polymerase-binding protein DksA n=1 Tax=Thioalkalivibrio sulfidiphilus TaxID=1033854 RepID=UPI003B324525